MKDIPRPYTPDMRAAGTVGDAGKPARVTSPEQVGLAHATDHSRVNQIPQLDKKTGSNVTPIVGRGLPAAVAPPHPAETTMPWQRVPGGIDRVSAITSPDAKKTPTNPIAKAPGTPAAATHRSPRAERARQPFQRTPERVTLLQRLYTSGDPARSVGTPVELAPHSEVSHPVVGSNDHSGEAAGDVPHTPREPQEELGEPPAASETQPPMPPRRGGGSIEGAAGEGNRGQNLDLVVDLGATAALIDLVKSHGMTIERGSILNTRNSRDFRETFALTLDDMKAIEAYLGGGARGVNDFLRGKRQRVTPLIKEEYFGKLMSLFQTGSRLPISVGGEILYRGTRYVDAIYEPGLTSSTWSAKVGLGFARTSVRRHSSGYLERLVLPKGVRFLPIGGSEKEVVLEPGLFSNRLAFHPKGSEVYDIFDSEATHVEIAPVGFDGVYDFSIQRSK